MSDKFTGAQLFNLVGSSSNGKSTYEIWKSLGNEGTPEDFLEYLREGGSDVSEEVLAQIQQNTNDISELFKQIANQSIVIVQDGNTLTIDNGGVE